MRVRGREKISVAWKCAGVVILFLFTGLSNIYAQSPKADFSIQTEACIDEKLTVSNHSVFGDTYSWDFCEGDLMSTVSAGPGAALSGAFNPKDMDVVVEDGALYGFVTSRSTNTIYRIEFSFQGSTVPVVTNLGNISSLLSGPEQIKIVKEGTLWYGLVINGATSSLIRIDFGSSLKNIPSAHHILDGISTVNSGMDIASIGGDWVVVATNSATQKLAIVNFGNSITNDLQPTDIIVTPTIPGISAPDDVQLARHNGSWYAFVIGFNSRTIHRLKFGSDLFSTPEMSVVAGPVLTTNQRPSGLRIHRDAGRYVMFMQTFDGSLFRMDLGTDLENSNPSFTNLGSLGLLGNSVNLELIKDNSTWYGFVINQSKLKVDRIFFEDQCSATVFVSNEQVPVNVGYTEAGTHAVSLTVEDGKRDYDYKSQYVTVTSLVAPEIEILSQNVCLTNVVHFQVQTVAGLASYHWDFGDQSNISTEAAPDYQFSRTGPFDVMLKAFASNGCANTARKRIVIYDPPTSNFSFTAPICTNSVTMFTNGTPDIYEGNLSYEWYVDNDLVSTSRGLEYTFTTAAAKTIKLKTAIPGCEDENIQVTPAVEVGPEVDFTFSGTCEDDLFMFQQQISGAVETYYWNFDDGNTSANPDPGHQFTSFGNYSVSLSATNAVGCENVKTKPVRVYAKPMVDFTAEGPPHACSGSPFSFQNTTTTPDDTEITRWLWAFQDVANDLTSDEENPEYVVQTPGTFPVSLTATTAAGCTATLEKSITIHPSPSTAFSFTPLCEDVPVYFTSPEDPIIESSYWEFGTSYSYDASPLHTFAAPGDYRVYAEFYGSNGCISTIEKMVRVPVPLIPDFTVLKNCVDHQAVFTNTTQGKDLVTHTQWTFSNAASVSGSPVTQTFTQEGTETVTLHVTTESGCAYKTTRKIGIAPAPLAEFSAAPETGAYPLEVMFTNTSSQANHFLWHFMDGSGETSTLESPMHTFSQAGTFEVKLTSYNEQECEDTFVKTISTVAPYADADIEKVTLIQNADGTTKLVVTILNKGNTILKDLPLTFDFSGVLSLQEVTTDMIMPGSRYNFVLNPTVQNMQLSRYLCVSLSVHNDLTPEGNRSCNGLNTQLLVFPAYPNPANGNLQLEWIAPEGENVAVSLVDHLGRQIFKHTISATAGLNTRFLDLQGVHPGVYLLLVENKSAKIAQRIVVVD